MFGSKKRKKARELEAQLIAQDQAKVEQKFNAAIEEAREVKDPAQRIIALKKIEADISNKIRSIEADISNKSFKKGKKVLGMGAGSTALVTGGVIAGAVIAAPPLFLAVGPVLASGLIGSLFGAKKREDKALRKLGEPVAEYIDNLYFQISRINALTNTTITRNVEKISTSPLYGDVLALPGVSKQFSDVAAKHIKIAEIKKAEKAASPVEEKRSAAPREKQTPNYKDLGGL